MQKRFLALLKSLQKVVMSLRDMTGTERVNRYSREQTHNTYHNGVLNWFIIMFLLSPIYSMYGESIVMVQKFDVEIFVELSVLRSTESKKVVYKKCLSVCLCVCLSVRIARDQTDGPIFLKFGM